MKQDKEENNLLFLEHVIEALEKILKYTEGLDEDTFYVNEMARDAVIRQFEIAGEAANKLTKNFREKYPEAPWNKVITMRNILIHGYADVDIGIVWDTAKNDAPVLLEQIKIIYSRS